MNERIRELAKNAGIHPCNFDDNADLASPLTKFAELIVEECAKIARATPCPDFQEQRQQLGHTWDMAAIEAGRQIAKHFGIEK